MCQASEKRRVRFASIQGIERGDLPLAAEVWYADITQQIWATREIVKLAVLFTRYMNDPQEDLVSLHNIELSCHLDAGATLNVLRQMQSFGVVEAYSIKDGELQVSLCLSLLQRVKVLETRARIAELSGAWTLDAFLSREAADQWVPEVSDDEVPNDDAEPKLIVAA